MQIGFIGLGMMGAGMASNLQKAGHQLIVHDLSRQPASRHLTNGATWAESPRAVAEAVDIVFTSLPTPADWRRSAPARTGCCPASARVPHGSICPPTRSASCALCMRSWRSTAWSSSMRRSAVVRAVPTAGVWQSGSAATRRCSTNTSPCSTRWASRALYRSDRCRIDRQAGAQRRLCRGEIAMAEVFTMGVKAGVDPLPLWEAIRQGPMAVPPLFDRIADQFLPGNYDQAEFALRIIHKDVSLACRLARESACRCVDQHGTARS